MDNLEGNTQEGTPEPQAVDNSQTEEARKEERRQQQAAGSKQEVDKRKATAFDSAKTAAELDGNSLLDLHKKDPDLALEVAGSLGYDSIKSVEDFLNPPEEKEDDFDKRYDERRAKEIHKDSLSKAGKIINKLDDDLKGNAQKYFDKLSKGRQLDEETAMEYAEMATLYVSRDKIKEGKFSNAMAQLGSTGVGNSKKTTNKEPKYILNGAGELVLDSNNKN